MEKKTFGDINLAALNPSPSTLVEAESRGHGLWNSSLVKRTVVFMGQP